MLFACVLSDIPVLHCSWDKTIDFIYPAYLTNRVYLYRPTKNIVPDSKVFSSPEFTMVLKRERRRGLIF